ncbi:MAG: hypothetical protein LUC45_06885 [Paraprevotella sp.]|nr:hypothetical protein [Paraprevotella sp.]
MAINKVRMVRCDDCKHGKYMQWMKNPIICECNWTGERYVAEAKRLCARYEEFVGIEKPEVVHFDHY